MHRGGSLIGIVLFTLISFYLFTVFTTDVYCKGDANIYCSKVSQVQANDLVNTLQDISEVTESMESEKNEGESMAQEIVSRKAQEHREYMKESEKQAKIELQKQQEYEEKLREEGKVIVAEYEAERQEKLGEK